MIFLITLGQWNKLLQSCFGEHVSKQLHSLALALIWSHISGHLTKISPILILFFCSVLVSTNAFEKTLVQCRGQWVFQRFSAENSCLLLLEMRLMRAVRVNQNSEVANRKTKTNNYAAKTLGGTAELVIILFGFISTSGTFHITHGYLRFKKKTC